MPRNSLFPLISTVLTVAFLAAGCSFDPADPVQADTQEETPPPGQSVSPSPAETGQPFLRRNPTVSSMQVQPPQGRDPLMEQGARFMVEVNDRKKKLAKDPNDKEALYFLGNANFDIKRFKKAREYYQKFLELDPDHPGVRTDLASTYFQTNDVSSALRELNRVLEKKPDHPAALFNLGLILDTDNRDRKKAIEVWERLLEKHPDYARAVEVRQRLEEIRKSS